MRFRRRLTLWWRRFIKRIVPGIIAFVFVLSGAFFPRVQSILGIYIFRGLEARLVGFVIAALAIFVFLAYLEATDAREV